MRNSLEILKYFDKYGEKYIHSDRNPCKFIGFLWPRANVDLENIDA